MKTTKTRIALQTFVLAAALVVPSVAFSQDKGQWYAFGAAGSQTGTSGMQIGGGLGYERFVHKGLSWGGEFGAFGGNEARIVLSTNGSYHFRQSASRKLVPFGTAGASALAACGDGCGAEGAFNFGAGINYWFRPDRALRVELRDYVGAHNRVEMRVGFAF